MTSAGPWSVKGIDPKAREIAKDLARRSGMTLGEWLNQMIIDGGEPEAPPFEPRADEFRRQGPSPSLGVRDIFRGTYHDEPPPGDDVGRITRALDSLSARLEAAEHRSTLAISGIDQSVMGVLARMDGVEREQTSIGAGFHASLDEVRQTQSKLAERLKRMEGEDSARVEAMKSLESALARVAGQIYEGESRARAGLTEVRQDLSGMVRRVDQIDAKVDAKADRGSPELVETVVARISERLEAAESRTTEAMLALEAHFAGLDDRLKAAETRLGPDAEADTPERRFERLAAELSEKVEASRTEMAERMRQAADGKLDRMEIALRDIALHVEKAERQSAQAIDRMGREVVRVAQTLGKRVAGVESRSAAAVEQVGGEVARIADAMENRMRGADTDQSEALEKLGGEIARIAERLADRIASSERRSAQAIEEVGDQVARVTDKLNQRYDHVSGDLSERIRQSEERTAKLLQEAQDKLDRRLVDAQRRTAIEAAVQEADGPTARTATPPDVAFGASFEGPDTADPFPEDPFAPEAPAPGAAAPAAAAGPALSDFAPSAFPDDLGPEAEPQLGDDGYVASYGPSTPAPAPAPEFEPEAYDPPPSRASTRELIAAARAAARQASAPDRGRRGRDIDAALPGAAPAPADEDEEPRKRFGGLRLGKRKSKKKEANTLRTALLASTTAAALGLTGAGMYLVATNDGAPAAEVAASDAQPVLGDTIGESTAAEILAPALLDDGGETAAAQSAPAPAATPSPAAAPLPAPAPAATTTPASGPTPAQLYSQAVRQIDSGDNTGLEALRRAANMGHAPAQFYLAKLYETGGGGLNKDAAEARRWTERAAASGDAKAMHNLALYYFEGTGGSKNPVTAASWFRRAAEAGLEDSQYNLARLYEQGIGVPQNQAEAYKWYLIAAASGDSEAQSSADRLRVQLSPDSQAAAQRSATAFRGQSRQAAN